jgi:hypothetical protein
VPKLQKPPSKKAPAKKPVKEGVAQVVLVQKVEGEMVTQNSRGRQIKLPTQFKKFISSCTIFRLILNRSRLLLLNQLNLWLINRIIYKFTVGIDFTRDFLGAGIM